MKIIVDELKTTLSQSFSVYKREHLGAIRPFLYKHLSPSGTFTFSIIQNATTLGSKNFTSADIEALDGVTALNYYHGAFRVLFDNPIVLNPGTVEIKLSHSGYTFSESAYLGWIREHERTVNQFTDTGNDFQNPLAVELWTWKGGSVGRTLDISDTFTSATTPSTSFPDSSNYIEYANDAAYEAVHGTPGGSEVYFNTTSNTVRVHDGTSWREAAIFE